MFNNLTKLTKILKKKFQCNRFCFISVGVYGVLRFLNSIKNLEQLPRNKFEKKKKNILQNILQYTNCFGIAMFSWWFSWFFRNINVYQCLFTLNILFDEVDRGLGHEKKKNSVRYHLYRFKKKKNSYR